ncbi:MAG: carbohydrate binding domain-containing protein, partial [Pontiellaceae bacterium]|nr:carbohydrate binding domain-containing protein [Pontiellaceae bacterium]
QIKQDWTNTITGSLGLTNSSAYAKQNGKPVVCIWGIGCDGNPGNGTSWNDVVNFFKGKNCYVIIGTKRTWATNTISVYTNANMISPWTVGAFTNIAGANSYANQMASEQTLLNNRGQDFQPVVFAGFSWANWKDSPQNKIPRYHGDFMWSQFYNIRNKNIPNVYVAMFDEYDEATAIAKAAENSGMKPTNQWFLTLDADGVACSSDYYLRLTGDGGRMVKNQTGRTSVHPTSHRISTNPNIVINPSFEVDTSSWTLTGAAARSTDTAAEGGVASMKLNAASSYARQTIPLEMGKAYEISVWINVTGLTAGSAYFDTTDKYDGTGQGQFSFSAVNGGWQRYLGSFTATNTSITLRCFTSSTFAGTAYYDLIDVRVQ